MCPRDLLLACFVFAGSPQSPEQPHMLGPRSAKELLDAHDAYVNDVQTNGSAPTLGELLPCAPSGVATIAHVCVADMVGQTSLERSQTLALGELRTRARCSRVHRGQPTFPATCPHCPSLIRTAIRRWAALPRSVGGR